MKIINLMEKLISHANLDLKDSNN